ncbi:MAG: hypothetical protein ABR596_01735 [Halarsenatibacteraceae bacterium]
MLRKTISIGGALVLILAIALVFSSPAMAIDELEDLLTEDLEIPTQVEDLIAKFSLLNYQVKTIENDTTSYDAFNSYQYLGQEEIQGETTDKLSLEIQPVGQEANSILLWIANNKFKQAKYQGEIIPGEMFNMMAGNILDAVFAPFQNISEYNLEELADIGEVTSGQKMIGDKEVEVITVRVENVPDSEIESGTVHLANLENFLMVVGFDYLSGVEDSQQIFEVTDFELR